MPKYQARYGPSGVRMAREALFRVLQLLQVKQEEWLVLRYLYDARIPAPQDRLQLFVRVHTIDGEENIPGTHLLREFFGPQTAKLEDACNVMSDSSSSIFVVRKDQELLADTKRDLLFYAPVPFKYSVENGNTDYDLDNIFQGLRHPCVVDLSLKPYHLSSHEKADLMKEIQDLDRLASGFEIERREQGDLASLTRPRDLVAVRHREYYQTYFDSMFSERIYEYSVRVWSSDQREGQVMASSLAQSLLPNARSKTVEREQTHLHHQNLCKSFRECRHFVETFELPNKIQCWSDQFLQGASDLVKVMEERVRRAARLSHLCTLIDMQTAARLLQLPVSEGTYFHTMRIESELRCLEQPSRTAAPKIEVGPQTERSGIATVSLDQFQRHTFVAGVTGSGKTTSVLNILTQLWQHHRVPFLVLEPVKSEYRVLSKCDALASALRIYTPGNERVSPFRFNPLEVPVGTTVEEHISALENCFSGAIPMFGPLPSLISEALEKCYQKSGFSLADIGSSQVSWPVMGDLVKATASIMATKGYVGEVQANLQAAIEVRLKSLCRRSVGRLFSHSQSSPTVDELLKCPTILEMESLNLDQQNLLILFLLTSIRERLTRLGPSKSLRQVIVLEEAHNLIGNQSVTNRMTEDLADPRGHAARFLVKLLAEVRALGVGIIIADQMPSAIASEVLKNTSVKLVHRVVSQDDRDALAGAMLLDRYAHEELARLQRGEAYLYNESLYRPIRVVSLAPTAQCERPDDQHLAGELQKTNWYRNGQKGRFQQLERELEMLLKNLRMLLVNAVQLARAKGQNAADHLAKVPYHVEAHKNKINEKIAAAELDQFMARSVHERGNDCRRRMEQLVNLASQQINEAVSQKH